MPTTPGASRPTRPYQKQSSGMPSAPRRSASAPTPRATPPKRPSTSSAHHYYKSKPSSPRTQSRAAQPSRSRSTPAPTPKSSSRTHSKSSGGTGTTKTSHHSTPHRHSRSAGQKHSSTQHVHRQAGSSPSRPVYVVCDRKHYDNGFYARCQRLLRKYVKWGDS